MDAEAIKNLLAHAVPFNHHLGIEIVDVGPGTGSVRMPFTPQLSNHVHTVHAGAQYSACEAASGAAIAGMLGDRLVDVTPLARDGSIRYRRPAQGDVTARAAATTTAADALAAVDRDGRCDVVVEVELAGADGEVASTATFTWHLRPARG